MVFAAGSAAVLAAPSVPVEMARGITGGAAGPTVRVSTPDELKYALCHSAAGGVCTDDAPRTIEVASTIDLSDTESTGHIQACHATSICTAPLQTEATLVMHPQDTHCDGKPLFDVTYRKAAVRGMLVGSNKTLLGVGAAGAIKGKGLLLQNGVHNIIVRNLAFTDINQGLVFGGDAITISQASQVWIDHNYFSRIGRQMLVTGTGDHQGRVTDLVVSWNEFDGRNTYSAMCNGKHYWNLLLYGNGNVTMADNWLHDFAGRGPRIQADVFVHLVNNYFQDGSWHALDADGPHTHVLMEGNYFDRVAVPSLRDKEPGAVFGLQAEVDSSSAACDAALHRPCVPNAVSGARPANSLQQDAAVLDDSRGMAQAAQLAISPSPDVPAAVRSGAGAGHW